MTLQLEESWKAILKNEFEKKYWQTLTAGVRADYLLNDPPIYPPAPKIFQAFALTPFEKVKVVILGQDPYHGPDQAMGLSFSVPDNQKIPPSLQNIYKEIESDLSIKKPTSGNLEQWATQGVLLLNATLTVEAHNAGSHQGRGWEQFTDAVIETISNKKEHVVFLLWGAYAGKKAELMDESKHLILKTTHPSPLSAHRGFLGSRHFSQTNHYLQSHNQKPIDWTIEKAQQ